MVIRRGVAFPMDEVLKGVGAAEEARVKNGIDLIMFFAVHEVREGMGKVGAMSGCFAIGR